MVGASAGICGWRGGEIQRAGLAEISISDSDLYSGHGSSRSSGVLSHKSSPAECGGELRSIYIMMMVRASGIMAYE